MSYAFRAKNYYEAARKTDGTSAPGGIMRFILHVGYNTWRILDESSDGIAVNYNHEGGVTMKERIENIREMWGLK